MLALFGCLLLVLLSAILALLILLPREEPSLPEYPGRTLPMLLAATGLVLCVGSFVSFFGDLYDFTAGGDTHFGRVVAGPFAIIAAVAPAAAAAPRKVRRLRHGAPVFSISDIYEVSLGWFSVVRPREASFYGGSPKKRNVSFTSF